MSRSIEFESSYLPWIQGRFFVAVLFLSVASCLNSWGAKCGYDSSSYRIMPKEIGRENEIFKSPYALPCDSMVVPAGQTTVIYEFSMLHFGVNPPSSSKIVVKGTLIVKGKPDHPVYFSGSVKQGELGYAPANAKWDGIEVDSGGAIRFQYARIFNAPTAMVIFSKNVFMVNSFFQGTAGILLPDTSISIGVEGTTIDTMDLRTTGFKYSNNKSDITEHGLKQSPSEKDSGSISGKKVAIYTLAGTALLAIGGVSYWALSSESKKTNSPPSSSGLDPDPAYPINPNSR